MAFIYANVLRILVSWLLLAEARRSDVISPIAISSTAHVFHHDIVSIGVAARRSLTPTPLRLARKIPPIIRRFKGIARKHDNRHQTHVQTIKTRQVQEAFFPVVSDSRILLIGWVACWVWFIGSGLTFVAVRRHGNVDTNTTQKQVTDASVSHLLASWPELVIPSFIFLSAVFVVNLVGRFYPVQNGQVQVGNVIGLSVGSVATLGVLLVGAFNCNEFPYLHYTGAILALVVGSILNFAISYDDIQEAFTRPISKRLSAARNEKKRFTFNNMFSNFYSVSAILILFVL